MNRTGNSAGGGFARVYGSPGEAPRLLGLLRAFWPLLLVCFAIGYLIRALLPAPDLELSEVGILFVLLAAASGLLFVWGGRRLDNYLKGAQGEEWVARELAFLPSAYTVFNGINLPGGKQNFDHIVVGPTGVFVVETKNWRGAVEFRDGRLYAGGREPSRPPLRQVKAAAAELVAYLDAAGMAGVQVHAVLCFVSTRLPEEVMNVNGVVVCAGPRLGGVMQEGFAGPVSVAVYDSVVHELRKTIRQPAGSEGG